MEVDRILDESHSIDKDNGEVSWGVEEHERPLKDFFLSACPSFIFQIWLKNFLDLKGTFEFF